MGQLRVGTCKRNVTPPVGAWMVGYAGRDHGAEGVHDELYVRAVFLDNGDTQAAIVCRDICFVGAQEMDLLAQKVKERVGLEREQLFIANSHTHSGPGTKYTDDSKNRDYVENLCDIVAGGLWEAREQLRPARLLHVQRPVQCGVNRRERKPDGRIVLGVNPEGPVDRVADLICFQDADSGSPMATLFRHAAHAVVMGSRSYLISGDFAGAAEAFVERNLPGVAGFLAGCSGNINAHPRETDGFKYVEVLGRRLGAAVVQGTTETHTPRTDVKIGCLCHDFELPLEPLPTLEQAEAAVKEWEQKAEAAESGEEVEGLGKWGTKRRLEQAQARHEALAAGEQITGLPFFAQVLALSDIALLGYPAEVFFEIGEQVSAGSPFPITLTATHVNGSVGYVPIASAFADGGYEVDNSRAHHRGLGITPECESVMVTESIEALEQASALVQ